MRKQALLLLLLVCLPAFAQRGAMTVPRNAAELTAQAATILRGRVVSARVEPLPAYPTLHTVVVTMAVDEVLKGSAGATYTYRQFIWDLRDRQDAAGYRKGQELLLMLNAPTALGLVSPAGLEQGRFRIRRLGTEVLALNGAGNYHLLQGVDTLSQARGIKLSPRVSTLAVQHRQGAVALDDLREVIRQFARTQ